MNVCIYKCYISIEMTFLKGLVVIKQGHKKIVAFVTIRILLLRFNQTSALDVRIY